MTDDIEPVFYPHEVLVIFTGSSDLACLRILSKDFRHCFIALRFAEAWIVLDPLWHRTDVRTLSPLPTHSLVAWYSAIGCHIVYLPLPGTAQAQGVLSPARKKMLPMPLHTCVTFIKRILNLEKNLIWTPRQLFTHLTAQKDVIHIPPHMPFLHE